MENQQFIDKLSLCVGVEVKDELYYYQLILLYVRIWNMNKMLFLVATVIITLYRIR